MKPIQRISITDAVVENIKEYIMSENCKVGDKLPPERFFCEDLEVSRTSVREAICILKAMGFIEQRPGKGAFIMKKDEAVHSPALTVSGSVPLDELMEVRTAIEIFAVRLCAQRTTETEIDEMEDAISEFEQAVKDKNIARMLMMDELFHVLIFKATKNILLIKMHKEIIEVFRNYRGKSFAAEEMYRNAIEPHQRIIKAIKAKDSAAAAAAMEEHLDVTLKDILKLAKK